MSPIMAVYSYLLILLEHLEIKKDLLKIIRGYDTKIEIYRANSMKS